MKNLKHKYSQYTHCNDDGFRRCGQLSEGLIPISILGSRWFRDEEWDKCRQFACFAFHYVIVGNDLLTHTDMTSEHSNFVRFA
jgi:lysophospholipid acyltransferase (LPLAT)-like uncharacterized protein